ncbi:MAG: S41 family peptidase [Blastocatellia bacterium]
MKTIKFATFLFALCLSLSSPGVVKRAFSVERDDPSGQQPPPSLKHSPAVSRMRIAFVHANDVWVAPRGGGAAVRLTDAPGMKFSPRFNPDGTRLAFSANLEGDLEIYTVPLAGGTPTRVTYLPSGEELCQWTRDDRLLFYTNSLSFNRLAMQLFTVTSGGGLPERLPLPYGADGAISDDGEWLAYTENWPNSLINTWKRYRGGMAQDIQLFNLRTHSAKQITTWEGVDHEPMWRGQTLYYVSDAGPEHRHNIWVYDLKTERHRQITRFEEYDVRNPSIGPGQQEQGEIVFQYGADIWLLDLKTEKAGKIEIVIPDEQRRVAPGASVAIDAAKFLTAIHASPGGGEVAVEARGDIWLIATGQGKNLTRTSGVFERDPAWSPDGRWIAYFSDASGEYELYLARADGSGEARRHTRLGAGFRYRPLWSPDSRLIAFTDHANAIYIHDIAGGETKRVDADLWGQQPRPSWSPDSSWLAYAKTGDNLFASVWLYHVKTGMTHQVTSGMFNDAAPAFDQSGNYLFFISTRNYAAPTRNSFSRNFVYENEDTLLAVPLRKGLASPLEAKQTKDELASMTLVIDLEGFEARAIRLPVQGWSLQALAVDYNGNPVYLSSRPGRGSELKTFDVGAQKEKSLSEGVIDFSLSADGRKLAARQGSGVAIIRLDSAQATSEQLPLSRMKVEIDRRAEWRQIFNDAWRLYRDFFYDPGMHGVDWPAARERYARILDACVTREDVNYVIGEMAGELNVGHAYIVRLGDVETPPNAASVGLLGADFELMNGAYRITRIYDGATWDVNARGPLSQPGVSVKTGDYLLAVNGRPVDADKDIRAAFGGFADREVTLTLSNKPVIDAGARQSAVKLLASERALRYSVWVEENRAYVERKTGGRAGYLHIPDFGAEGLNALVRQFYGQREKPALIIDARWSQGGSLGDIFARLLDRSTFNYLGGRYSQDQAVPTPLHRGPKLLLVSGMTVSAGENFAYYFRKTGLGRIVGMRTWGGLIGLNGNPALIDGGYVNVPNAPFFEDDGTWMIEGHGVEPDVKAADDPALLAKREQPQLDAAIKLTLEELQRNPYRKPRRPVYPDRSRMGIEERDK